MAETMHQSDSTSTLASLEGWEWGDLASKKGEVIAKLTARVTALEADNKLLKQEEKGLVLGVTNNFTILH